MLFLLMFASVLQIFFPKSYGPRMWETRSQER